MEKKFNEIVYSLIQLGYSFNNEWTINTKNHTLENKRYGHGTDIYVFYIDGDIWDWPETVLDNVISEL